MTSDTATYKSSVGKLTISLILSIALTLSLLYILLSPMGLFDYMVTNILEIRVQISNFIIFQAGNDATIHVSLILQLAKVMILIALGLFTIVLTVGIGFTPLLYHIEKNTKT